MSASAGRERHLLIVDDDDRIRDLLKAYLSRAGFRVSAAAGVPLRIGVVGVWTDAKVNFLLYDLKTRLGFDALSTCSALTQLDLSYNDKIGADGERALSLHVRNTETHAPLTIGLQQRGWLKPAGGAA